jgi:hypothetical protein
LGFPEAYPDRVVRNIDKIMTGKKDTLPHLTYYIILKRNPIDNSDTNPEWKTA